MAPTNKYELFTRVRLRATFQRQDTGATIDPSQVLLYVHEPDGTVVIRNYDGGDGDIVRDDQGLYHYDIDLSVAGQWQYKFEGFGTVECGSKDVMLWVNHSHLVGSRWPTGAMLVGEGMAAGDTILVP